MRQFLTACDTHIDEKFTKKFLGVACDTHIDEKFTKKFLGVRACLRA